MKKKLKLMSLASLALLVLAACGRSDVTSQSSGLWSQIVYAFAKIIQFLSFGGSVGIGIIIFTVLLRTVLLPLFHIQIKTTQKTQELQPQIRALRDKYPGKDAESRRKLSEETQKLYAEQGVNPYMGCLPLVIQMPFLWALYQALTRVDFLRHGQFLWINMANKDHLFILPILAAIFTFLSTWLNAKAQSEKNVMTTSMMYAMPIMIFFFAMNMASGVSLYWAVSNAYQVGQTLLLNNPFKVIAERREKEAAEKQRRSQMRKAKKKAGKKRR